MDRGYRAFDAESVSSHSSSDSYQLNDEKADGTPAIYSPSLEKRGGNGLEAEELLMERHLLQQRLTEVETQLREKQDDLFFQSIQLKEKAAKAQELAVELQKEKDKNVLAMRQVDDLQKTCQAQYSQNLELQYFLRQHKSAEAKRLSAAPPPPDGAEKFNRQKDTVLRMINRTKRLSSRNQKLMEQNAQHEQHAMWLEDSRESTHGQLLQIIRDKDDALKRQQTVNSMNAAGRLGRAQSLHAGMASQRSEASWELPNHNIRTLLTTTEDTYIDCKIKRSAFEAQLNQLKNELKPALKQHKDASDKALTSLWYIYTNKKATFRPKEDFFKELTQAMTKSKVFVADMLRRMNNVMKSFLKEEKEIKETWRLQNVPDNHVACEATEEDFPPPPDPMVEELSKEVLILKQRLQTVREESAQREQKAVFNQDKAECSLKFLQKRFFELHQELYTALHQVYKHRYKWTARFPDPLRNIAKKGQPLDVQFNIHLDRIIAKDVEYCKRFGEYMTSDETFGVDMTAICEERERVKAEKLKRRDSRVAPAGDGKDDDKDKDRKDHKGGRRHTAPTMPAPQGWDRRKAAEKGESVEEKEWDMTRMTSWRQKQQQIWERRRSGMMLQERERTVYIGTTQGVDEPPPVLHGIHTNVEQPTSTKSSTSNKTSPKDGAATRVHQAMRDVGTRAPSPVAGEIPVGLATVEISGVKVKQPNPNFRAPSPPELPAAAAAAAEPEPDTAPTAPPERRASYTGPAPQKPAAERYSYHTQAEAKAEPQPGAPLSRASTEIFNRVILKRRNLPLRVARSEGKDLVEGSYGSGYLLEGSKVRKQSLTAAA